jgi:antitoxin CcdA
MQGRTRRHGALGLRIRRARQAVGLSQKDLAETLRVTAGAVGQWELGITGPKREILAQVAVALGVPLTELVETSTDGHSSAVSPVAAESRFVRSMAAGSIAIDMDAGLVSRANEAGIDVSNELNTHLRGLLSKVRRERWLEENREALADANTFLERHGLWSDGKRQF